ncbi:MAG: hypothetical protein ACE5HB_10490 [Terriglobia bacterium]
MSNSARDALLANELKVLQAMCSGTPQGTIWDKAMLALGGYEFRDLVHQLVFDALREINTDLPDVIRKHLPARLTNKGFPSLDCEKFFLSHGLSAAQALALVETLRAAAPDP